MRAERLASAWMEARRIGSVHWYSCEERARREREREFHIYIVDFNHSNTHVQMARRTWTFISTFPTYGSMETSIWFCDKKKRIAWAYLQRKEGEKIGLEFRNFALFKFHLVVNNWIVDIVFRLTGCICVHSIFSPSWCVRDKFWCAKFKSVHFIAYRDNIVKFKLVTRKRPSRSRWLQPENGTSIERRLVQLWDIEMMNTICM